MLQGSLADVEQLAYITIVQPIGMLALFPECLVAGLGKTEYLVPQLCPIRVRNDKISHSFIVILFVIPLSVLRFIARFCLQKYEEFITLQSSRETSGS